MFLVYTMQTGKMVGVVCDLSTGIPRAKLIIQAMVLLFISRVVCELQYKMLSNS